MNKWHIYRLSDGIFTGQSVTCAEQLVGMNTPEGCGAATAVSNWESQRVDVASGLLVDYQPPLPDEDHVWDPQRRRNVIKPEVAERRAKKKNGQDEVGQRELSTLRTLRELVLLMTKGRQLSAEEQVLVDRLDKEDKRIRKVADDSGLSDDTP